MTRFVTYATCLTICLSLIAGRSASAQNQRATINFDADWKFSLGDSEGAEAIGFDDNDWRTLDVPHDWAFEADYHPEAAQTDRGGYKPGGIGWYRKTFTLPKDWNNGRMRIELDAVFMNSDVWINGTHLGRRPYGYISFGYDLTEHLAEGVNTIAVRVDSRLEPAARWYHGCGIYGHVKLVTTPPVHVVDGGIYITTPGVSENEAVVKVATEIVNESTTPRVVRVQTGISNAEGATYSDLKTTDPITLQPGQTATIPQQLLISNPKLWDTDNPYLYKVITLVMSDDNQIDGVITRMGVRTIRWDTKTGFWLNGKNVKLCGVCDHSEAGPVGAAVTDELLRWKIRLLKEMGCNAIRTAHNPQTPKFYDICDEMGILVMDEIFDGWRQKAANDYGSQAFNEWWERDLRAWLLRDRNHPCVIIWSLGNETRGEVAADMVRVCHEVDPSRLTTSGHSGSEAMDVLGVNGHSEKQHFYKHAPTKPFVATEAPHTWQVRGFYRTQAWFRDGYPNNRQDPFPCPDLTDEEIFTYDWTAPENRANRKQIFNTSYDIGMVRITARKNWELMRDLPWYSGHFRWTGFDYLGEAGYVHGGWPFRAFMGGPLDLAGFKKDLFYFYQSQWTDEPMVHILPHWTHPKMKEGTEIPVWVYSNCDEVELLFNGKSLGRDRPGKAWDQMQCDWMVPWTPGTVQAIGYRDGKEVVRTQQTTAGAPASLNVTLEGESCPIITVVQADDQGVTNPYAENRIHYHIEGPARILSLESGNPVNTENNTTGTSRTAFFGLGRAFLQTTSDEGDISVIVGAICGEKQLMTSKQVDIVTKRLTVRGQSQTDDLRILYSLDESKPSMEYTAPLTIEPGTTVRADVYRGDALLFSMSERFGPDEGIYWGSSDQPAPVSIDAGGDQAESAKYEQATVSTVGRDYHGRGYLDFGHNRGAFVQWYQENDGSAGEYILQIRYSGKAKGRSGRPMKLTVNEKTETLFFPNTEGYGTDWKTLDVKIKLQSGANTIRITTVEAGGMCIDDISVR